MTTKLNDIEALNAKVISLRAELADYENLLHDAKVAAAGIAIGDVVRHPKHGLFQVTDIDTGWSGKPWLKGNPQRKDGSFSRAERHIGTTWERVDQ